MQKFDVIINGGGFAGLSAALGFAGAGLKVAVIEPQSVEEILANKNDKRTTALSYITRKYFESVGVWEEIVKQAGPINDIKIFDADFVRGDSLLNLTFSYTDVEKELGSAEPMGHIVVNHYFKDCLLNACLAQPNIKIFEKETIAHLEQNSAHVEVELSSDLALQAKLLVAADGRNSAVRDMLGITTTEKDYHQTGMTFIISHEKPHNQIAVERFLPAGPFAVLPMHDPLQSGIVWTVHPDHAVHFMKMNEDDLHEQIAKRMGDFLGEFKVISPKSAYPLKLKYAKQYYSGRCVLIADAAHGIHPIAGQGFNQGAKDIKLLVELVKQQLEVGLDIADGTMLEKYQKERLHDNQKMIMATDFFVKIFSNDKKVITAARRIGIKAVDMLPPIKKFFIRNAMGA